MNTKRIGRWVIVLFLLAALPVMTAAVAQGQEPAGKAPLPAVTEIGESSPDVDWVNNEHEPNNTMATAEEPWVCDDYYFNCVVGGTIGYSGDVDYWSLRFDYGRDATHYPVLIDVEAVSNGSPVDTVICLYADDGVLVGCNDDTDTLDSMLFFNFEVERTYYLRVTNWGSGGGADFKYQFYASTPLLISATTTGTVAGIPFQPGDILAYSCAYGLGDLARWGCVADRWEKWVMFLDLSDLNVTGNISNLAAGWRNSDYVLVGFAANTTLPGITGPVTPWDVVRFDPSQVGPATAGTFTRWWGGKQHELTTTGEKIDAIDWPMWNGHTRLYVSTAGAAKMGAIPNVTQLADEDVGLWTDTPFWTRHFDGNIWPGLAVEDVVAMDVAEYGTFPNDHDWMMLVIQGSGVIGDNRLRVNQKSIFQVYRNLYSGSPSDAYLIWNGPSHGWRYNIDAIDFPVLDMDCMSC